MQPFLIVALSSISVLAMACSASAQGDAEKGEQVFKRCAVCHAVGEGAKRRVGPPLNDIIGAQAGTQRDFRYSRSMREAGEQGLIWTRETLHDYLENPKRLVPGGTMAFPGLKREDERDDVIAYLEQFSDPAEPTQ